MKTMKINTMTNNRIVIKAIIILAIIITNYSNSSAQYFNTPFDFTNRPLGMLSDASAVHWNPAMLGVRGTADLLIGVPLDNNFGLMSKQFDIFAKSNAFGVGFSMDKYPNNIDSEKFVKTFFAGMGYPLKQHSLWWGASVMYRGTFGEKYGLRTFRYNTSLVYSPFAALITSVGISNMYCEFDDVYWYYTVAYSPFEWMTVHANINYSPQGLYKFNEKISPDVYVSFGGLKDYLIASIGYRDIDKSIRLGIEVSLNNISAGYIPKMTEGHYEGSVAYLRLTNEKFLNAADFSKRYTISTSFFNASVSNNGYIWNASDNSAEPEKVMDILFNSNSSNNKELYSQLLNSSPKPDVFKYIANNYYTNVNTVNTTKIRNTKKTKDTLSNEPLPSDALYSQNLFTSPWKYDIVINNIDSSNTDTTKIIFKVKDSFGRDIPNLSRKDFLALDSSRPILSVREVPADPKQKIDLIFLQDCSNTLESQLENIKPSLKNFFSALDSKGFDYHIGGIWYGEQIYKVLHPSADTSKFIKAYSQVSANAPDEVTSIAINEAMNLDFRPEASKIFIVISDDAVFQTNSSIKEKDLIEKLWKLGASIYSVADFRRYNSGLLTKFTLGREYQISDDINNTLLRIANDIQTTYEINIGSR